MKKDALHIGCSSFSNAYWKGIFYPENLPRSEWFSFYCRHFDSYEINASFYRFPTVRTLTTWYGKAPDGFVFAVKAPKVITHLKRFVDCKDEVEKFYAVCREGLKEKLGPILFQLPPGIPYGREKLDLILSYMNLRFDNVIEFRNATWWQKEVFDALAQHNVSFSTVSYPGLPESVIETNDTGYVRLHGRPKLFYSNYSDAELQHLYNEMKKTKWKKAYVYFNNTASAAGSVNALKLNEIRGI